LGVLFSVVITLEALLQKEGVVLIRAGWLFNQGHGRGKERAIIARVLSAPIPTHRV
jgi:hypothetical protein